MDLKRILMQKGLTQIELSKKIGVSHVQLSLQMCKHRMLPKKYREKFCSIMEITQKELEDCMKFEGVSNG